MSVTFYLFVHFFPFRFVQRQRVGNSSLKFNCILYLENNEPGLGIWDMPKKKSRKKKDKNESEPVLKGFKTFVALVQSLMT